MTPSILNESELHRLEKTAVDYQTRGYDVKLRPRATDLPDFLSAFAPDLIASGHGENIVVQVKTRTELKRALLFTELESAIRDRPGWRFELIIDGTATESRQTLSPAQIRAFLDEATELAQRQHSAAALLVLWSATEGALRLLADRERVELESPAPGYLLQRLYTLGLLSREQYQTLDGAMRLRDQAAHGFQAAVTPEDLASMAVVLNGLLNEVEVKAA